MVWIILIAAAVVILGALAWWSSGRARPIVHRQRRDLTEAEKNVHYQTNQMQTRTTRGSGGFGI